MEGLDIWPEQTVCLKWFPRGKNVLNNFEQLYQNKFKKNYQASSNPLISEFLHEMLMIYRVFLNQRKTEVVKPRHSLD